MENLTIVTNVKGDIVTVPCTEESFLNVIKLVKEFGGYICPPSNEIRITGNFPNKEQANLFLMSYLLEYGERFDEKV